MNQVKLLENFLLAENFITQIANKKTLYLQNKKRVIYIKTLFIFSVISGKCFFNPAKYFIQHTRLFFKMNR